MPVQLSIGALIFLNHFFMACLIKKWDDASFSGIRQAFESCYAAENLIGNRRNRTCQLVTETSESWPSDYSGSSMGTLHALFISFPMLMLTVTRLLYTKRSPTNHNPETVFPNKNTYSHIISLDSNIIMVTLWTKLYVITFCLYVYSFIRELWKQIHLWRWPRVSVWVRTFAIAVQSHELNFCCPHLSNLDSPGTRSPAIRHVQPTSWVTV